MKRLTRRGLFHGAAVGGAFGLTHPAIVATAFGLLVGPPYARALDETSEGLRLAATPFPLGAVRLLDSEFTAARDRDVAYLLSLEPDRMMTLFEQHAGFTPTAKPYGGWDQGGRTLGHCLSACSLHYAESGDARFLDRVNAIVDKLARCQAARADGYIGPIAPRVFDSIRSGVVEPVRKNAPAAAKVSGAEWTGVPWYWEHKMFAGLLDAHAYCGNAKALEICARLADWADSVTAPLSDAQRQRMLATEHGGMLESLVEVAARTGDPKYLRVADRFYHKAVLDPLAQGRGDVLPGLHANTQIPKLIGLARRYELTGNPADRAAAEFFWSEVVHHHTYANGGNSMNEHFGPPDRIGGALTGPLTETCNTYNMLKLTRHLFCQAPRGELADYYEQALYNHILASQDRATGMMAYKYGLYGGYFPCYSTPENSFWCCVGTGIENHVKYGESIYFHDDGGLWVNLYIPSELKWKDKGLTLRQQTRFPDDDDVTFAFSCERPVRLALRLRVPQWTGPGFAVAVNGQPVGRKDATGGYYVVDREWREGDVARLRLPMSLRMAPTPDVPSRVAFFYGPVLLAGLLGADNMPPKGIYGWTAPQPAKLPLPPLRVFTRTDRPLEEWMKRDGGQPLAFHTVDAVSPADVALVPVWRVDHQRYAVYWDTSEASMLAGSGEDLRRRTVDEVVIADARSEREHNLQGAKMQTGTAFKRPWRHATSGGWFSYDLKVLPDAAMTLRCAYWGSDAGRRVFDIQANGETIATQTLSRNMPGRFFDVEYPIAPALTRGQQSVTVRFSPKEGNLAGGLYGLRILKPAR